MATEASQSNKQDVVIKKPSMYKVIFNNDNATPMDFVIELLKVVFHQTAEEASKTTTEIHENGKGIAGIYTYEVAEQKHIEATHIARNNGHPLNINLESQQ
jgi:ATP-dependent Clp protease adaptor protein ClpS